MKTIAHHTMTQKERSAFGLALVRAVAVVLACVHAKLVAATNIIKRHISKPVISVSRLIEMGWKRSDSIRGASPRVANG